METKYGVRIPCDDNGRPLRDAPGRYSQAAAAMGGLTEHKPPILVARLHNNGLEVRVDLGNTGRDWPNCGEQYQPGFPWLTFPRIAWREAEIWARKHGATEIIRTGRRTEIDP